LRVGTTPNSLDIARSLKIANESATKQTQVSLKAGAKDGEIDAVLKVIDERPTKFSMSFDNIAGASTVFGARYNDLASE